MTLHAALSFPELRCLLDDQEQRSDRSQQRKKLMVTGIIMGGSLVMILWNRNDHTCLALEGVEEGSALPLSAPSFWQRAHTCMFGNRARNL